MLVFVPQQILEQHFQGEGKPRHIRMARFLERLQTENLYVLFSCAETGFGAEGISVRFRRRGAHARIDAPIKIVQRV